VTCSPAPHPETSRRLGRAFRRAVATVALLASAALSPSPSFAADAATAPVLAPSPAQVEAARDALRAGVPVPPEAKALLEANPALKEAVRKEAEGVAGKGAETGETGSRKADEKKSEEKKGDGASAGRVSARGPYDWLASPYLSRLFGSRLSADERKGLSHFGHDLFDGGAGAVLEDAPLSPSYVVGPGDQVIVRTWGRLEETVRMTVDRDGKIFYPRIGSLQVAGKSFGDLRTFLKGKIGAMAEVRADVTLGELKASRVAVVGEVASPGWLQVSTFHTALQALAMAGGVRDIGSLRRVEIRRHGAPFAKIDLYDLLLMGDNSGDVRLQQGDTIFVPVAGKLVAVSGDVRRPAIYELKDEKTLSDAVAMAGGFAPSAWTRRVQVERLEGNEARTVLDVDASDLAKGKEGAFALADGDVVRIFPVVAEGERSVTLEGNVERPGKYELKAGMTVASLLAGGKGLLPDTWYDYALLTRVVPPEMRRETAAVDLRKILLDGRKEADVPLRPRDTLTVYSRTSFRDAPKATVSGEVRRPGSYDLRGGMRVSDLVRMAGDLTRAALPERAELVRVDERRRLVTLYFDLGKAMAGDAASDLLLQEEDQVRVHSVWETRVRPVVTVSGEVNQPGDQLLTEGMKLSDLLFKAGGIRGSGYAAEAELTRRVVGEKGDEVRTETVRVFPSKALAGDGAADLPLRDGDRLNVRGFGDWNRQGRVTVSGEVRFPGAYAVGSGERLSSLVRRAGGFTPDAYLAAARFTRESTRKSQQEAIDRLVEELEQEIAARSQEVGGALDKEDLEANRELLSARRSLVAQLKKAKAAGRVVIRLADAEALAGTENDILLEEGDRLEIPPKGNVVTVMGRVYNPTGVVYDANAPEAGHYLSLVGGPTGAADRDHIFVLRADGSVVTDGNAPKGFLGFGGGVLSAKVAPGDSVVVPDKLVQVRLMKDVKDITQILYQIAVTAGVLIVAF
jgi:protein involved in polysaccharide export with SLBB domain